MWLAIFHGLFWLACCLELASAASGFSHAGTPPAVPHEFDCKTRTLAWKYGKKRQPSRGSFQSLFDALQLQACGLKRPETPDVWKAPHFRLDQGQETGRDVFYVDSKLGSDAHPGTLQQPFLSLAQAVQKAASHPRPVTISLRKGVHYTGTIVITDKHRGLKIQNHNGEEAIVSGGNPFFVAKKAWKLYRKETNTWVADVSTAQLTTVPGLRLNGQRAIRAKYPNGNPEESGNWYESLDQGFGQGRYVRGWIENETTWLPPRPKPKATNVIANAKDWPSVEWPMEHAGDGDDSYTGMGDMGNFSLGIGSYCDDLTPPVGYWCGMPPRQTDGGLNHMSPAGLVVPEGVLPNAAKYTTLRGAVVQAFGTGRWFSWQFEVDKWDNSTRTIHFSPRVGGHQGAEGAKAGKQWYIENVKEECDSPEEYYYDKETQKLYYTFNGTGPTGSEQWVSTAAKELFIINGTKDITIQGLTLRDTAYSYFDPAGMPSGGDWVLQRTGAINMEGVERVDISNNLLTHLDGNGIMVNGYARNVSITSNEVAWIGGTAIAQWGHTGTCLNEECTRTIPFKVGPDGRRGEQPWSTKIHDNLVREIGIWQKQSSMYFQAIAGKTSLKGNVHFNGPRAGINLNDGFGGGDDIRSNLVLNCVRETGDHGPLNSWDRIPYITNNDEGTPSIIPRYRTIAHNFILGTYNTQAGLDNDDGSSYYTSHHNFLVYGSMGLKTDFKGHHNKHMSNIYAYTGACFAIGNFDAFHDNHCILADKSHNYKSTNGLATGMEVYRNHIYTVDGRLQVGNMTFAEWQKQGHDTETRLDTWPDTDKLLGLAWSTLEGDEAWDPNAMPLPASTSTPNPGSGIDIPS